MLENQKVIFTIFAGRKRYLKILLVYTDKLLEKKIINEVHFWAFTTNQEDIEYLKQKNIFDNRYKIFFPPSPEKRIWGHYYQYYGNILDDSDLIIKCDDDIVYIDLYKVKNFIESVDENGLYFPNIVNNDVCAYFQQEKGIHKLFDYSIDRNLIYNSKGNGEWLTTWFSDQHKADDIHSLFLSDCCKFHLNNQNIIEYGDRISINFFCGKGIYVKKIFKEMHIDVDDELFLGQTPKYFKTHKINLNLTVVHFQFCKQNSDLLDQKYLEQYEKISQEI